jgi:mRNA-degrading endonuclease RelE of RelBE toxin-antitoxin system
MNFEILTSSYFDAEAKRLAKRHRSFANDLETFQNELLKNPYQGAELTPGIRKIRMTIASKGRGSSGGARVITLTFTISEETGSIILLLLYDKADASSVKVSVIKKIAKEIGFDLDALQKTGQLKPVAIPETSVEKVKEDKKRIT